ncbi:MAG TPA: hypothetical protein VG104_05250 [Candidatus Dormibacteraeota bacterium]|jgi:hypothetical protein|nr:hypothetical protein [Candidatus Dormibacteraeota bacterium]
MRRSFIPFRLLPAAIVASGLALTAVLPASAHEVRTVGAYQFTVGWLHEPAYADEQNAVQFLLKDSKGSPVTDLGDTLKVEVIYQTQKMPALSLNPTFDPDTGLGMPGEYLASVIPTRPGKYTFHFTGSVKGQAVDQSFTSSPTTFDEVKEPTAVEFPTQDPTRAQVSQRLDRVDSRLAAAQTTAKNDAELARNLAIAAIVLGALGTVGLIITLSRRSAVR